MIRAWRREQGAWRREQGAWRKAERELRITCKV